MMLMLPRFVLEDVTYKGYPAEWWKLDWQSVTDGETADEWAARSVCPVSVLVVNGETRAMVCL